MASQIDFRSSNTYTFSLTTKLASISGEAPGVPLPHAQGLKLCLFGDTQMPGVFQDLRDKASSTLSYSAWVPARFLPLPALHAGHFPYGLGTCPSLPPNTRWGLLTLAPSWPSLHACRCLGRKSDQEDMLQLTKWQLEQAAVGLFG